MSDTAVRVIWSETVEYCSTIMVNDEVLARAKQVSETSGCKPEDGLWFALAEAGSWWDPQRDYHEDCTDVIDRNLAWALFAPEEVTP